MLRNAIIRKKKKEIFSWNYVTFSEETGGLFKQHDIFVIGIATENTVGLVQAVVHISICYFAEKRMSEFLCTA